MHGLGSDNAQSTRARRAAAMVLAFTGVGAGLIGGCGEEADDRGPVLRAIADAGIAAHGELAAEADALVGALEALCAAPDAGALTAAQGQWGVTQAAWAGAAAFALGPELEHAAAIDFWPARVDSIEAAIAAAPAIVDDAYLDGLGASAKGLPVLEYMLFGEGEDGGDPAAALAALVDPGAGAGRCAYASAVAVDVAGRAAAIDDAWRGSFADALASAGEGSSIYSSRKLAIDAVVNHSIDVLSVAVKAELDAPLGNLSGAPPDPTVLRARFSGEARESLAAELDGVWAVYHGVDAAAPARGISVLVAAIDGDVDVRVREQYAFTTATIAALPTPQGPALTSQRDAFQAARDDLDTLRRLLKLDVASTLGVTLSLSDNDGD